MNLPDTVSVIGDSAFEACTMLESIGLPDQLTAIGEDAFKNCAELTVVYFNNPYAARYMEENNIDTAPLGKGVMIYSTVYPDSNSSVALEWANTGSDIYMLRLFHSPELKPVYSENNPDQIEYTYNSGDAYYKGSSP